MSVIRRCFRCLKARDRACSEEKGAPRLKHAVTPFCAEKMVDLVDNRLASCLADFTPNLVSSKAYSSAEISRGVPSSAVTSAARLFNFCEFWLFMEQILQSSSICSSLQIQTPRTFGNQRPVRITYPIQPPPAHPSNQYTEYPTRAILDDASLALLLFIKGLFFTRLATLNDAFIKLLTPSGVSSFRRYHIWLIATCQ